MAVDPVDVQIVTTADNAGIAETESGLASVKAAAADTAATAATSFDNFNSSLKNFGNEASAAGRALLPVTVATAAVGYESIKSAMNFQQSMEMLHTNAGVAQSSIAGLSDAVLKLAPQVGQGPEELATAMYHIASAGNGLWSTSQQLDILKTAAEGAAIGQASLDDTTYSLTSALASNVTGAKNASEMMSTLVAIVGAGDMHMQDLNAAIGTGFLGTAASFGVSIQSVGAALATLGDNGEQGAAAATRLRMMLSLMASPSQEASKQLSALGLTASDAATATGTMSTVFAKTGLSTTKLADDLRQPNGITVAVEDLKSHLESAGLSASETDAILSKAFGGGRTDAALLQLLQNTDRLNVKFQDINASTGKFASDFAAQQQTAKQQWDQAWAGIQSDLVRLGDDLLPTVTQWFHSLSNGVSDLSHWLENLSSGQRSFVIDTIAVTAAMGPLLLIFGKLASSMSSILTLSKTVGGALGLLGDSAGGAGLAKTAAGISGLGTAAEAAAPEAAGLGIALGPVALAVAGVAAVGIGAAVIIHKLSDDHAAAAKNATAQANAEANVAKTATTAAGAHTLAAASMDKYNRSSNTATASTNDLKAAQMTAHTAQLNFNDAVAASAKALAQYGPNSKQYTSAMEAQMSANQQLQKAQSALTGAQNTSNSAQQSLNKSTANLSASYQIQQENQGKLSQLTKELTTAKGQEQSAHNQVDQAVRNYNTALQLTGPYSSQTKQASTELADAQNNLKGKTTDVSNIENQLKSVHAQLKTETDNLRGSLNQLGSSYDSVAQKANAAASAEQKAGNNSGFLGSLKSILHFATGVQNFGGGMAVVGEEGPELVYLPAGSDVVPTQQTQQILSGGGSASPYGGSSGGTTNNRSVTIGQVVLSSAAAVSQFFSQLDVDTLSVSKGLTASRGV